MGRAYSCWMLNWWCITWPVGFKRFINISLTERLDAKRARSRKLSTCKLSYKDAVFLCYRLNPPNTSTGSRQWITYLHCTVNSFNYLTALCRERDPRPPSAKFLIKYSILWSLPRGKINYTACSSYSVCWTSLWKSSGRAIHLHVNILWTDGTESKEKVYRLPMFNLSFL